MSNKFEHGSHVPVEQLKLTFPETEKEVVEVVYEAADTILEYGSGGSTMLAACLGKHVTAVESDSGWAASLNDIMGQHGYADHAKVIHSDIGPVQAGALATWLFLISFPDKPIVQGIGFKSYVIFRV